MVDNVSVNVRRVKLTKQVSDKTTTDIYKMKLHGEAIVYDSKGNVLCHIIRVPGGWLYDGSFIPMNKEFQS
jgi:hypothetical protein